MSDQEKDQRMLKEDHQRNDAVTASDDLLASFGALSVDVLANILGFLLIKDIMRSRRINKKTMEAVRNTVVPPTDFVVNTVKKYNAVVVMTRAMPNLQKITLKFLGGRRKWSDGEDPDQRRAAEYADRTSHDIGIISNFRKLRYLAIYNSDLNGSYPFLFNSFPLLQTLCINNCIYLKWDLEMLAELPVLKKLECFNNHRLTGKVSSLRVLKDTLERVKIRCCDNVEGNFMDLADFPHLKKLDLGETAVIGDIRDIGENDFPSL